MGNTKAVPRPEDDGVWSKERLKYHLLQAVGVDYERDDFDYEEAPFWTKGDRFECRQIYAEEWRSLAYLYFDDITWEDVEEMYRYEIRNQFQQEVGGSISNDRPDKAFWKHLYFEFNQKGLINS